MSPDTPPEPAPPAAAPDPMAAAAGMDPIALLRTRQYVVLLVLGAMVGVPAAAMAYFFLKLVAELQKYVFTTLPVNLGFDSTPSWWPIPFLAIGGLLTAVAILYLPGTAGHEPSRGFQPSGAVPPIELPGIIAAAFATLAFGAVLGPEAPLIAMGSGLGVLIVHLVKKDAPAMAALVIGGAGSFAAVSALLGSPILGAFLLMEAGGLGGALMGVVLVPGLLASGIGFLIFLGLDSWTGFGTFSLTIPNIPSFTQANGYEFLWAIGIGIVAAFLGTAIKRGALLAQPFVARRRLILTPLMGVVVGVAAMIYALATGRNPQEVLYSGQDALPGLLENAASFTVGTLVVLLLCKSVSYSASLSAFRGGPTFPGMFVGAVGGIALSHLPGLPMIAGAAMGIGAMTVVMLGLPLTSVLLTTLFLQVDGLPLMPLVIVSVVVAYVASARLAPRLPDPAPAAAAPASG